jgi:DOMON domain
MKIIFIKSLIAIIGLLSCQNTAVNHTQKNSEMVQLKDPKRIDVNGMTVEWTYGKDRVFFTISAPTEGWIVLGFNEKDDIIGTNLIFGRVQSGKIEVADHFTIAAGNHKPTEKLGGTAVFADVSGEEKSGNTTIRFSMPTKALDAYHFDLTEGSEKWFICAFSAEDDFYHHSRMREHRKVTL